jgi:hypothetical protein
MMRWLSQWRAGPVAALIVAWVAGSGAWLTLYFVAQARIVQREYTEMGFRLGPTAAHLQVDWVAMWPQLAAIYLVIVVLPPALLWLLWRQGRRIP